MLHHARRHVGVVVLHADRAEADDDAADVPEAPRSWIVEGGETLAA